MADLGERVRNSLATRIENLDRLIENSEEINYDDTRRYVEENENASTKRKTESDMKKFEKFLTIKNEVRKPEEIPPADLDIYMAQFFMVAKKDKPDKNGDTAYEPSIIEGFQASVYRYLKKAGYEENKLQVQPFQTSEGHKNG